ncbi:hypothetical protein FS837_009730 [Tulasnella sp. UAMH 9824]|nr:hypothetical protein FS837_009730 [Tulasnella sp. UAMH 9824]
MFPVPLPTIYRIQTAYGHKNQCSQHVQYSNPHQEQTPLSYPPTLEKPPSQQVMASTSALRLPASTLPPYYQQQPTSSSSSWLSQGYQLPVQSLDLFDDISPAFKGKAFIYDCMVRALESLNPEGASVKEIFEHVWVHNRALILARSRDGDTEAGRRASTRSTIVNYLSTSPAFDSIGRNRWVLTGKKHGIDKRGRKSSRSTKRRPRNSSHNSLRGESDTVFADSDLSSSSPSSTASPDIPSRPAHHVTTLDQPSMNGSHNRDSNTSATLVNSPIVPHGPETAPLALSDGLIQGPTQTSALSTSSVPNRLHLREHQVQQRRQDQEGLTIVSALPSHEAPFSPGVSGTNTTIPGATNNTRSQRETLSYGQSAQSATSISTTTVALARGSGTRRSCDAVPLILPPRPPRTLHPDNLDPFAVPIWTSSKATTRPSTSPVFPPFTTPCGPLFQIPSNTSYYEAPSVTVPSASYTHQESNPPTTPSSSSFHAPRALDQRFAQVDPQGDDCAGDSIPVAHQHHNNSQVQQFGDHDTFAARSGFV